MSLGKTIKSIKAAENSTLLVTPRIEQFMRDNPEGVIWDEDGHALFKEIAKATFGGNSDRSGRFGASGRGTCHRRQVFSYLGMPEGRIMDIDTAILFSDGKWRHLRWQMLGMQSGALTHAEYPLSMPKYRLRSSVDGLNTVDSFLFELKGDRNMSRLLDNGVPEAHNLQMHTMLMMTGWEVFSYLMEDKSTQQFREIVVKRDPAVIREVRQELEELNEHVEHRTLPEVLPSCRAKEGSYRTCPYGPQCLARDSEFGNFWPDTAGDWTT